MPLFCAGCGGSLHTDARFCSSCGRAVTDPNAAPEFRQGSAAGPFLRPRAGRKIAGVCQGLANQYHWDVMVVRVIAVVLALAVFPVGLVAYGLFWVLVPEEPQFLPPVTNLNTTM